MSIQVGDKIPKATLNYLKDGVQAIDTDELFGGRKVVMFAVPGAFTPTCSAKHLPGYVQHLAEFEKRGYEVACLSVNDAFVMKAWAEAHDALGKIVMLADGTAAFSKALGIDVDLDKFGMGVRCGRGLFIVEDGTVTSVEMEAPGKLEVSSAEACALKL